MNGISHLELMPEPDDPNLMTAVDADAPGYPGKEYGVSDEEAKELRWPAGPIMRILWPWGAKGFSLSILILIRPWSTVAPILGQVLPASEWA